MRPTLLPSWGDVLLAVVLTGLTLATLVAQQPASSPTAVVLSVLSVAPLAWRQRLPVATAAVVLAALAGYSLLGYGDSPNNGIGMFVAVFTVATLRPRRVTALVFAVSAVVTVLVYANASTAVVWSQVAQALLTVLGAWVLGEATHRWAERTERVAAHAAADAAAGAAEAVAQERVRIARELHDSVAHHMAVISLQAGVAEYVLDEDLETARGAIATVSATGRDALVDLRRLLDVLRLEPGEDDRRVPQPGLAQLARLVTHAEAAGLRVETSVTGTVRPLPPGLDLCTYRVAQESLTNVVKHAGAGTATIVLDYGATGLRLTVADDGSRLRSGRAYQESHGIRGMRERAQVYGGRLVAGPTETGGFRVCLELPTDVA